MFENLTERVDLETRYNTLVQVQGETIDHLAEGVAVFGPDGRIRLSNPAFRAIWGISETEAQPGTHIRAIEQACLASYDQPDGWKRFAHIITSFDDERPSSRGILELRTGLILDYAVIPLPNAQTMLTFVNITDSVRVERALTEKNEALRKADALKNDFVHHVSYELRSPLTNIIGFADLLKTPVFGELNERQAEYVDHIATSSSLLLTIVNDILDLQPSMPASSSSTLGSEYHRPDRRRDAADGRPADRERRVASNRCTRQSRPHHRGPAAAEADLHKASHQCGEFRAGREHDRAQMLARGERLRLLRHRHRTGHPAGRSQHRVQPLRKLGQRGGAGLGLSIVESFVSLHHGNVSIRSKEGEGTAVTCRIPSAEAPKVIAAE